MKDFYKSVTCICVFDLFFVPLPRNYVDMGKRLILIVLAVFSCAVMNGSVVTLRSGKTVQGEVLVQNDEVVIVKTAEGARFQYPSSEVVSVTESKAGDEETAEKPDEEDKKQGGKKTTILVALSGGGTVIPMQSSGGHIGGELMIGSRYIGKKAIFVGGGVSVHGMFAGGKSYTFLPLQLAVKVPFMEGKHAPYAGAALGYGFALNSGNKGGIYSGAEVGYRLAFNPRSTFLVSLAARFQQATISGVDTIKNEDGTASEFINHAGRSFVTIGVNVGITF